MAVDLANPCVVSHDSVFGDLDCNDNTPVLQPQPLHNYSKTQLDVSEMSATRCHLMSSFASPSHSNVSDVSSNSHQMAPDDALNNDFFYEDEFAVQFDMQLTAGDADHDALLSVSQLCYGDGGATVWWSHLGGSRSDSCLYELELERSGSSEQYSSQELSLSDHNTSDVSDLPSEPLFASPLVQDSGSSSVNARFGQNELSGSFRNEDGRYDYDWRANKDQYTLSFDQTPARPSSQGSSSGQNSDCLSATTSWAEKAGSATSESPRYTSWADRLSSSSSDQERAPPSAVLTSWKQLKEGSSSDEGEGGMRGMTSWQEAGKGTGKGSTNRSRSLPDLKSRQRSDSRDGVDAAQTVSCGGNNDCSLSLFELFQKLRSQSDDDASPTDVIVSPNTLRRLTGTWSMSGTSFGADSASTPSDHVTCDDGDDDDASRKTLMSWKTFTDVSHDVPGNVPGAMHCGKCVQVEDCAIQTSLEERKLTTTMDRSLQTSLEAQPGGATNRKRGDAAAQTQVTALSKSAASLHGFHSQLSSSVFETCAPLPDLSFLKPAMSHSAMGEKPTPAIGRREYGSRGKGTRSDTVMQRLCRMTSAISKLTDEGGQMQRTRSRSSESASTNSCCSSSSSGIDPGSYHESQNTSRTAAYINDNASRFGVKSEAALDDVDGRNSCENCRRIKAILAPETQDTSATPGDSKDMMASHPCYSRPSVARRKGTLKRVDYLQVSPTHCPRGATYLVFSDNEMRCCDGKVGMLVPVVAGNGMCKEGRIHVRRRHAAGNTGKIRDAELQLMKRPLKSCLVKRRKRDRDRDKAVALKHRSWSHPQDALVLKYSHDGETQYQLVTAGQPASTSTPTDIQQTSLPADALQYQIEAHGDAVVMPTADLICSVEKEAVKSPSMQLLSKSSEAIPVPACTCGTACAILHSSSESNESTTSEAGRRKKCVSFAEKVSYASPYCSPHLSPQKRSSKIIAMATGGGEQRVCEVTIADGVGEMPGWKTLNFQTAVPSHLPLRKSSSSDSDLSLESAPHEFMVSPPPPGGATACPVVGVWESPEVYEKKDLVHGILKASERLLDYFGQTRDVSDKVALGDSGQYPEVGHLVLSHLCPAVQAVMVDGLRPYVRSLFGQVKNNVWKMVEDTSELGPSTRVLHELVQDLKRLQHLNTVSLKFNAFIFGLLNRQALDFWLSQLTCHESAVVKHYLPDSFLRLSTTQPIKRLLLDMTAALQPLSQISFQLEYSFESRILSVEKCRMSESLSPKEGKRDVGGEKAGERRREMTHDDPRSQSASWHQQLKRTVGEQWVGQGAPLWRSTAASLVGRLPESWDVGGIAHRVKRSFLSPVVASVPELVGINDTDGDASNDDTDGKTAVAETIVRDNEVVGGEEKEREGREEEEGESWSQWGRQLIQELNPPKKVYKKGVTEYAFDTEMEPLVALSEGNSGHAAEADSGVGSHHPEDVCDSDGGSTKSDDNAPTDFAIPPLEGDHPMDNVSESSSGSGSGSGSDVAPTNFRVPSSQSDGSLTMASSLSHALMSPTAQALKGSVKKSLSGFGLSLINVFDRLLLDESKVKKEHKGHRGQSGVKTDSVTPVDSPVSVGDTQTHGQSDRTMAVASGSQSADHTVSGQSTHRRVRALCYYIANDNEHLSFDKGSEMMVVGQVDHDWLRCRQGNSEGVVYAACVETITETATR